MRSILYKREMYDATAIKKIKTETRRNHGLDGVNIAPDKWVITSKSFIDDGRLEVGFSCKGTSYGTVISRYKRNEIVYLAEPMWVFKKECLKNPNALVASDIPHLYDYDMTDKQRSAAIETVKSGMWKKVSPLLMKQEYGRHFVQLLDISIERVQDISRESIIAEGVVGGDTLLDTTVLREMYATLWDKINGVGQWKKNPFVFVYKQQLLTNYNRRLANA